MKIFKLAQDEDYKGQHGAPSIEVAAPLHDLTANGIYPADIYGDSWKDYSSGSPSDYEAFSIIRSAKGRPHKRVTMYRSVPDVNHDIDKEIRDINKLLSYKSKYGFLPIGNKKVYKLEEKYEKGEGKSWPMERELNEWLAQNVGNTAWDWAKEMVSKDLRSEVASLRSQRHPNLQINSGDWVAITKAYAIEHGQSNLNGSFKILQKTVPASTLYTNGDSIQEWAYLR